MAFRIFAWTLTSALHKELENIFRLGEHSLDLSGMRHVQHERIRPGKRQWVLPQKRILILSTTGPGKTSFSFPGSAFMSASDM